MFAKMLQALMRDVIGILSKVEVRAREDVDALEAQRRRESEMKQIEIHEASDSLHEPEEPAEAAASQHTTVRRGTKVGRNDPCPCGSGKSTSNVTGN